MKKGIASSMMVRLSRFEKVRRICSLMVFLLSCLG